MKDFNQVYIFDIVTKDEISIYLNFCEAKGCEARAARIIKGEVKRRECSVAYVRCYNGRFCTWAAGNSYDECAAIASSACDINAFIDMRVVKKLEELFT